MKANTFETETTRAWLILEDKVKRVNAEVLKLGNRVKHDGKYYDPGEYFGHAEDARKALVSRLRARIDKLKTEQRIVEQRLREVAGRR